MEAFVPFGSLDYFVFFSLLLFSRGMDFLSTWLATPSLALEGNPIAKWLGWKWGIPLNLALCAGLGTWPLAAVVVSTTSLLVAARNFQHAWWMRALGESGYQRLVSDIMSRTPVALFLACLLGETLPFAVIGGGIMWVGQHRPFFLAIGLGIVAYAMVVMLYTLLSLWRARRRFQ